MKTHKKIHAILIAVLIFTLASCEKEQMERPIVKHQSKESYNIPYNKPVYAPKQNNNVNENMEPVAGPDIILDTTGTSNRF